MGGAPYAQISTARAGLFAGLACSVPVAVWLGAELLGEFRSPPSAHLMRSAVEGLSIVQAFAAILLPRGSEEAGASRKIALRPGLLGASLVLASVSAPLWVVIAGTRVVSGGWLVATISLVAAFVVVAPQVLAVCERLLCERLPFSLARIATGILEASAALAIWMSSDLWMR